MKAKILFVLCLIIAESLFAMEEASGEKLPYWGEGNECLEGGTTNDSQRLELLLEENRALKEDLERLTKRFVATVLICSFGFSFSGTLLMLCSSLCCN